MTGWTVPCTKPAGCVFPRFGFRRRRDPGFRVFQVSSAAWTLARALASVKGGLMLPVFMLLVMSFSFTDCCPYNCRFCARPSWGQALDADLPDEDFWDRKSQGLKHVSWSLLCPTIFVVHRFWSFKFSQSSVLMFVPGSAGFLNGHFAASQAFTASVSLVSIPFANSLCRAHK